MEFDLITNMDRERHFEATTGADSCLTIIGNGFDLHHDLATKYSDYRDWLVGHDKQVIADFASFDYATECLDRTQLAI